MGTQWRNFANYCSAFLQAECPSCLRTNSFKALKLLLTKPCTLVNSVCTVTATQYSKAHTINNVSPTNSKTNKCIYIWTPCLGSSVPGTLYLYLFRDYNCDSNTIWLWSDHDVSRAAASIRRKQNMNMSIFCRSHIVVLSQSNWTHIMISITSIVVEYVVVSSYHSRIVVESQLW